VVRWWSVRLFTCPERLDAPPSTSSFARWHRTARSACRPPHRGNRLLKHPWSGEWAVPSWSQRPHSGCGLM